MLATGIKSPVGVKVSGTDLREIDRIGAAIEQAVKQVPGVTSALAERLTGGRYIDVKIDRARASRYGLNIGGRAERRFIRGRRRQHWGDRRGAAALSHQSALSARVAGLGAEAADLPVLTERWRADPAG